MGPGDGCLVYSPARIGMEVGLFPRPSTGGRSLLVNVGSAERGMFLRLLDDEVIEQNVGTDLRVRTVY